MLTLILLVVLGGGAGLLAVWLIDARGLSDLVDRSGWRSLRRTRPRGTTGPGPLGAPGHAANPAPDTGRAPAGLTPEPDRALPPPSLQPVAVPTSTTTAPVTYVPVEAPLEPLPTRSARRDATRVPAAYTAVEGAYREVARVPLWRKVMSLVWLLVTLLVIGVAIAAIVGATLGLVAELVDSAIG